MSSWEANAVAKNYVPGDKNHLPLMIGVLLLKSNLCHLSFIARGPRVIFAWPENDLNFDQLCNQASAWSWWHFSSGLHKRLIKQHGGQVLQSSFFGVFWVWHKQSGSHSKQDDRDHQQTSSAHYNLLHYHVSNMQYMSLWWVTRSASHVRAIHIQSSTVCFCIIICRSHSEWF